MSRVDFSQMRIGVLFGGDSSEREISLRSGKAVLQGLLKRGFQAKPIDPQNQSQVQKGLSQIDLAFIALHGKGGEDGSIQRLLERARIPYVGSGPRASRLAFNKVETKRIFGRTGIPTAPWKSFTQRDWREMKDFPTPFVVKPVSNGSSIGVFFVEDFEREAEKIMLALERYSVLLIEKRIEGREFTVGILGAEALPVIELKPKNEFYDYEAKYTSGMAEYLVPAPIPPSWQERFCSLALEVHQVLGLRDFSRVDLMVDRDGKPYVLEANTIPGFTELSLLPKAAKEAGIPFEELCERLVKMAWERSRKNGKA